MSQIIKHSEWICLESRLIFLPLVAHSFFCCLVLCCYCAQQTPPFPAGSILNIVKEPKGGLFIHMQTNMCVRRGIIWGISIHNILKGEVLIFIPVTFEKANKNFEVKVDMYKKGPKV